LKFSSLMFDFMKQARKWLRPKGYCVLVLGSIAGNKTSINTARIATDIAVKKIGGFKLESVVTNMIPETRRSRRRGHRTKTESIVVLRKGG
jgi:hypothetical protein